MADVTLKEVIQITGKSKRTIQRYISSGKLSYKNGPDRKKLFDRYEVGLLIGEVSPLVTPDMSPQMSPQMSPLQFKTELSELFSAKLSEAMKPLIDENKLIREELKQLKQELKRIAAPVKETKQKPKERTAKPKNKVIKKSTDNTPSYLDDMPVFGKH